MVANQTIYFLIVNFNGSKDTIELLKSIDTINRTNSSLQVVIIDNNSDEADTIIIKQFIDGLDWIIFLKSEFNIGYFPGFNIGLDYIREKLPATVLLCNNDLLFEKNFLQTYQNTKYNDDVFVVAPNVITLNGDHQNPHLISKISTARKIMNEIYFLHYFLAKVLKIFSTYLRKLRKQNQIKDSETSQYIYMGIGACYILRPVFFQHISKLDDRIFLGGEEALLAGQLEKSRGKTYYDSSLVVHHTEGVSFSKMSSRWRYEISKKSYRIYKQYL